MTNAVVILIGAKNLITTPFFKKILRYAQDDNSVSHNDYVAVTKRLFLKFKWRCATAKSYNKTYISGKNLTSKERKKDEILLIVLFLFIKSAKNGLIL